MFQTRAASSSSPGCGLRQEQRAESSCGQTPTPSSCRKRCRRRFISETCSAGNQAARDIGLIGDQDQGESGFAQFAAGFANARQQAQVRERGGRIGFALTENGAIHDAIAIQEHGAAHALSEPPQPGVGEHGIQGHA